MKRLLVLAVILAWAATACAEPIGEGQPLTTLPAAGGGEGATSTAAIGAATAGASTTTAGASTTTAGASTTTSPAVTTTAAAGTDTMGIKVYFMLEGGGRDSRPGPFLVPVYREIPRTQEVAAAALDRLIAGPSADERAGVPGLSSAVPADTIVLGISIDEGLATVDLSREFEAGGGTFSMACRLAQVVLTLTQFPTVQLVEFRLDGEPVSVFSSEGIIMDRPVGRDDYRELTPLILVDSPAYGAPAGNPLRVTGAAAVFEAQFNWVLADGEGRIIAAGGALTDNGMGWGSFDFTIEYSVDRPQVGSLTVFDYSAEDGSQENVRAHPLWLTP